MRRFALALLAIAWPAVALGQPEPGLMPANGGMAENHIVSSIPSTFTGININNFVGANTFYGAGYTGTRSRLANIEAGHVWTGHESLNQVGQIINLNAGPTVSVNTPGGEVDRHATWVGAAMVGRLGGGAQGEHQRGIAFGATLYSGAIAHSWNGAAYRQSFNIDVNPFTNYWSNLATPYRQALITGVGGNTADVVNSSWGFQGVPGGNSGESRVFDALIRQTGKVVVFSAGNSSNPNTIGGPGNGHNAIVVGATGPGNAYSTVAGFSSRGPQNISRPNDNVVNTNNYTTNPGGQTRARVDIVAPGEDLTLAFYGGTTGGNSPPGDGAPVGPNFYTGGAQGTSFSAPIVAAGIGLIVDRGRDLGLSNITDTRVLKSILLNSATKIPGWTNSMAGIGTGGNPFLTTRALDDNSGAGQMNLTNAFAYLNNDATRDVAGVGGGTINAIGYDFGRVTEGAVTSGNAYTFAQQLEGGTTATITLNWLANRIDTGPVNSPQLTENNFARLFLHVYSGTPGSGTLIARSEAPWIGTQHLNFVVPTTGDYYIQVNYSQENWDFINNTQENYGLAWNVTFAPIPEPTTLALVGLGVVGYGYYHRRQKRRADLKAAMADELYS